MHVAFYYPGWKDGDINGTQDAVTLLCRYLRDEQSYTCEIFDRHCDQKELDLFDVLVCLSSASGIDIHKVNTTKVLWNHCWEYVEMVDFVLDSFDVVMGLSPKHAKHMETSDWCYNGIDTEVFYRNDEMKYPGTVIYCGGPAWWKGSRKIREIRTLLQNDGFNLEETWELSQQQLAKKFNETQFVVIPSEAESFCLVSIQAQACGCIPIAHDVGGVSEAIPDELKKWCLYKDEFNVDSFRDIPENASRSCMENSKKFHIEKTAKRFHEIMCNV